MFAKYCKDKHNIQTYSKMTTKIIVEYLAYVKDRGKYTVVVDEYTRKINNPTIKLKALSNTRKAREFITDTQFKILPKVFDALKSVKTYLNIFDKAEVIMALERTGIRQKLIHYAYGILKNWFNTDAKRFDALFIYEKSY